MSQEQTGYPISAIRALLQAAFTAETLPRFCRDRAPFRPVLARFGPGQGLDDMVDEVIEFCDVQLLWEELLREVAQVNPRQYRKFWQKLPAEDRARCPPPPSERPPPTTPPPARPSLVRQRWFWPAVGGAFLLAAVVIVILPLVLDGERPVEVPNVSGLSEDAASSQITRLGLRVGATTTENHETVQAGTVIRTDPRAGTEVEPDSSVKLVLSSGHPPVPIPELLGLAEADARKLLEEACLPRPCFAVRVEYEVSDDVEVGDVIRTDPAEGEEQPPDSPVTLYVAEQRPTVEVPDVSGLTEEAASSQITRRGLAVGATTIENHETVEAGTVIRTEPPASTEVEQNSAVTLVLSSGHPPVPIPEVIGLTETGARRLLEEACLPRPCFAVRVEYEVSDDLEVGEVIRTDPAEGEEQPPGSLVTLYVAEQRPTVEVPDVSGLTEEAASSQITRRGLAVGATTTENHKTVEVGRVIRTDPRAGTEVELDSTVKLVISSGHPPVPVPELLGLAEVSARRLLEEACLPRPCFEVRVLYEINDEVEVGDVIRTDPAEGEVLPPGAAVTLYVSEPRPEAEKPPPGTVQGTVLWNEQPVEGATVNAHDQYGASSTRYGSAMTDASGGFSISGIPEGKQYLFVYGNQPEFWVAVVTPIQMPAETGTLAEDTYLCKGFNPDSPKDGEVIGTSRPILKWARYENAVDYAVRVIRVGESKFVFQRGDHDARITDTSVQVDVELSPGEYRWRVDAFNSAGHIIGCSYSPRSFTIR